MRNWGRVQVPGAFAYAMLLVWMGYFGDRTFFFANLLAYSLLFVLLFAFIQHTTLSKKHVFAWLIVGMLLRILLLGSTPQLSDDYFRFIWDGHLTVLGFNPYYATPAEILPSLADKELLFFRRLYENLNSPTYYSIYPPSNQAVFALASWLGGTTILANIVALRGILVAFEAGVLVVLWKLSHRLNIDPKQILLYALNPMVILEITGNLHFEGVMLFFLLLAFFYFLKQKKQAGIWFGIAISIKLTPLILVPLFFSYLRRYQLLIFLSTSVLACVILFFPLIGNIGNFLESMRLYYGKFEFNAGLYYLIRYISMFWIPYNPIGYISPLMTGVAVVLIGLIAWKKPLNGLLPNAVFVYFVYLCLHTVVHPWYLIIPLGMSVLTSIRSFQVWSYVVFLSYASYAYPEAKESVFPLLLQYGSVFGMAFFDYRSASHSEGRST